MKTINIFIFLLIALFLTSCAHVITKETREEAEKELTFADVLSDIDAYNGKTFIWGGFVAKVRPSDDGSYIEVVQNPINKYGEIQDTDVSEGRFLAYSEKFLDPLIYEKGRRVTVAGTLADKKEIERKSGTYVYPVLTIKEIHLWREYEPVYPDYWYYDYPPPYWWYTPWPYWPYGPYRHHRH